jgi:hypothetical protein
MNRANRVRRTLLAAAGLAAAAPTIFFAQSVPARRGAPDSASPPADGRDTTELPAPVQDMRVSILRAASSGNLDEIRYVLERNEIMPVLSAQGKVADPLEHFRAQSADGEGLELMAALIEVLTVGYAVKQQPDTQMYVWPHFAERGVNNLSAAERVQLYRLVSPEEAERMAETGYDHYRLGIGADGTWHFFYRGG